MVYLRENSGGQMERYIPPNRFMPHITSFKGTPVVNPYTPRVMKKGGYVNPTKHMIKKQLNNDSVFTILQPGEIVIPVKHKGKPLADKIIKHLAANKIYLKGMREALK